MFGRTCVQAQPKQHTPFIKEPSAGLREEDLRVSISTPSLEMVLPQPDLKLAVCKLTKYLSRTVGMACSKNILVSMLPRYR